MEEITDRTLVEGCVLKCSNVIMRKFGADPFTMEEMRASLRSVIETAERRLQCLKRLFGTNDMGDVFDDEAIVQQMKYMLEARHGDGNYTFLSVHPTILTTPGDDGVYYLIQGVMNRVAAGDAPTFAHYDTDDRKCYTQIVTAMDGTDGFEDDQVPRSKDDDWLHTLVVTADKKRFICHNLSDEFPNGVPIAHLGLGEDGQPKTDGEYYMRSIVRVYKVAPYAIAEVEAKLKKQTEQRRNKLMRSQHADFDGSEVLACTTTGCHTRPERHQPDWADDRDPVYGTRGKKNAGKRKSEITPAGGPRKATKSSM